MAKIRVITQSPIYDGILLTFKAPCDCTEVDGLRVYYPNATESSNESASKDFVFVDAHGEVLTGLGNLFKENAYVRAILDTDNGYAYLQNASTNAYLEKNLKCKTGSGKIHRLGTDIGNFEYSVCGNVVQITFNDVEIPASSGMKYNYFKLVDTTGNLPLIKGRSFAVQINSRDDSWGANEVLTANLSVGAYDEENDPNTLNWLLTILSLAPNITRICSATITLLNMPTA